MMPIPKTWFKSGPLTTTGSFILTIILLAGLQPAYAESRSTPKASVKMAGTESRFSLEDPRVVLKNIKETRKVKEPPIKTLPKGVTGSAYTPDEQESINVVEDLKKAYTENQFRPDGFGVEITQEIVSALGEIQSKRSADFLCQLLLDEQQVIELKTNMVEALRKIGDPKAMDSIKKHVEYLKKNQPTDPLAGQAWQDWIDQAQSVINELEAK
jgi:hypothetical protein